MNDAFFSFESDFVDSLRCIPMAVRLRLDLSGVKLKLNEWSKLGLADRGNLATLPCETPEEVLAYREYISALVERQCGASPSLLAAPPDLVWENGAEAPEQVLAQARALNLPMDGKAWSSLSTLQRFALVKLSRPGHENRNFLPAMREFGLAPVP